MCFAAHRARHEGRDQFPEAGGFPAVPQGHPCLALADRFPRIPRLHRKRPLGGAHHHSFARQQERVEPSFPTRAFVRRAASGLDDLELLDPHTIFVAERGLEHFALSLRAQYELTF